MKILVAGDSISFGRPKHNIRPENTWPYLLCSHFGADLTLRSQGGATVLDLLQDIRQLKNYYPGKYFDLAIVQVGIVDVTPRFISPKVRRLLRFSKTTDRIGTSFSRNKTLVKLFGKPIRSADSFERYLAELSELMDFLSKKQIYLSVFYPTGFLLRNCGDFKSLVDVFNRKIFNVARSGYCDLNDGFSYQDNILQDGYHLTRQGHMQVFERIIIA